MSTVFKDNAGREWVVAVNCYTIKVVKTLTGVHIPGLLDDGMAGLARLVADHSDLCDVLYCLCKEDADARGVSDRDFGKAMYGDAVDHGKAAFLESLADFFPDAPVRAALRKMTELSREVQRRAMTLMESQLAAVDVDTVARTLTPSAGASPGSSASTPPASRSGNSTSWPRARGKRSGRTPATS